MKTNMVSNVRCGKLYCMNKDASIIFMNKDFSTRIIQILLIFSILQLKPEKCSNT